MMKNHARKIYFVDDQHKRNFETVLAIWRVSKGNTEYMTACYILAVPMIFEKVENLIDDFKNPIDWIWRWEYKYNLSKLPEYQDDDEEEEIPEIPYDLTGSMIQLGKFSLNMWNSYEYFNLMNCLGRLDEENYQVLKCAMDMRLGIFS